MSIDVDQELSPRLLQATTLVGELLKSFPQAASEMELLLQMTIGPVRVLRITERIGTERVAQRDREAERVEHLRLVPKLDGSAGVIPPVVAAVMADGGRYQQNVEQAESHQHWYE